MSSRARRRLAVWLVLCLALAAARAGAQGILKLAPPKSEPAPPGAEAASLSVTDYLADLDRIVTATSSLVNREDAAPLIRSIPTKWNVQGSQQTFVVSSEWLRADLGEWQKKTKARILERIVFRLQTLRGEAESFQNNAADVSSERDRLKQILASREFEDVSEPDWWDRFKQRLREWIFHLLERVFNSSTIPTVSNVLVYGLIALAVAALGFWMYRTIRDSARVETVLPGTLPVSSKEWSVWMAEARAAAAAGNWRDAIHLAYWCGISFLEAQDMWPPDRARTPREYLRLLPATSQHHPVLRALTRSFEVVWYGTQAADDRAFSETVAQLEKLGCRYN